MPQPEPRFTKRRDGRWQQTCECEGYRFPHRLGSPNCWFHPDQDKCPACAEGYCVVHEVDIYSNDDPREEALTAAQRNVGLSQALRRGRFYP